MNTEPVKLRTAQSVGGTLGVGGLIFGAVQLLRGFGVPIDDTQQNLIVAFGTSFAAVAIQPIVAIWLRREVTPWDPVNGALTKDGVASSIVDERMLTYLTPHPDSTETVVPPAPDDAVVVYDPITGEPV
jgi:hypothetical protein